MKPTIENVSVIGLGKLGLPTATFFASQGCSVIGIDHSEALVNDLLDNIVRSEEPGLREMYLMHQEQIDVTTSVMQAVIASDMTFVIVPTPSLPSGEFSTEYVEAAAREIGRSLQQKSGWHLVVLVSTVMPEATRTKFIPAIERSSGKKCGDGFGVCYSPEFIALGSVLHNLAHPDFMLVGESDPRSGERLESFHKKILGGDVKVCRMNLENAELAKIAVNTFVTTKISYANMLAELAEKIPGMDVSVITAAIGLDARIGKRYLGTGLGYGGPCFPRDNKALAVFADNLGAHAYIAQATDKINASQAERLVSRIQLLCALQPLPKKKAAVLGMSYKQDTDVTEESQGMQIAQRMVDDRETFSGVSTFDQNGAMRSAEKSFNGSVSYASSLEDAIADADVVVIAVADKRLVPRFSSLKNGGNGVILVDPWRLVDPAQAPPDLIYLTVGKSIE